MCNEKNYCEKAGICKNYQPYVCDELCKFEPRSSGTSIMQIRDDIPWMTNDKMIEMPEGANVCRIDEQTYWWQFECMPPIEMGPRWFANSEPHSHVPEDGRYAATYGTYCYVNVGSETRFYFLGYFTRKQLADIQTIIQNRFCKI